MDGRLWLIVGAILASLSVAAGAYSAHGLKPRAMRSEIAADRWEDCETAARQQMNHAVGMVLAGLLALAAPPRWLVHLAGAAFLLGIALFCGGLYGYAFTGDKSWTSVAPAGGTTFMVAWLILAAAGWQAFAVEKPRQPA